MVNSRGNGIAYHGNDQKEVIRSPTLCQKCLDEKSEQHEKERSSEEDSNNSSYSMSNFVEGIHKAGRLTNFRASVVRHLDGCLLSVPAQVNKRTNTSTSQTIQEIRGGRGGIRVFQNGPFTKTS